MNKDNSIYIEHILDSLKKIKNYIENFDEESFNKDTKTQDAVIRQFEIIGEATKKISEDIKIKYLNIPWKDMAGMRDKLIHDYIDIDLTIVWKTALEDAPLLLRLLDQIK